MKQIQSLFLLNDGEFFQQFIEETNSIMQLIPNRAEQELNQIHLPQTLIQLNRDPDQQLFSFQLINSGFNFEDIKENNGLIRIGEIIQQNNFIRFQCLGSFQQKQSKSCSILCPTQQQIEQGFESTFRFRFRKNNINQQIVNEKRQSSSFSLILSGDDYERIQNLIDVEDIQDYVQIKLVYLEESEKSLVEIWVKSKEDKRMINLIEKEMDVNLGEEDEHEIGVEYIEEELKVVNKRRKGQNMIVQKIISLTLNLEKVLSLNCGKASILLSVTNNTQKMFVDLFSFKFSSFNFFNRNDPWNGLSINFNTPHPAHLLIDSSIIEKFNTFFRFLFPLRKVQIHLQQAWIHIKQFKQHQLRFTPEIKLRYLFSFFFNNLWVYFVEDLILQQSFKLQNQYFNVYDFEQLKKLLENYTLSLQKGFFLHVPHIVKLIFDIINLANEFLNILKRFQSDFQDFYDYDQKITQIQRQFNIISNNFINVVEIYCKQTNQDQVYNLLQKLNYQDYLSYIE